jgi:hypothetical protein
MKVRDTWSFVSKGDEKDTIFDEDEKHLCANTWTLGLTYHVHRIWYFPRNLIDYETVFQGFQVVQNMFVVYDNHIRCIEYGVLYDTIFIDDGTSSSVGPLALI